MHKRLRSNWLQKMSEEHRGIGKHPTPGLSAYREGFDVVHCHPELLDIPFHWKKPHRIFVCSMSDLFHKDVPDEFIDKVLAVAALNQRHTFMILTKRSERLWGFFMHRPWPCNIKVRDGIHACPWPLPNVWIGITAEDQQCADERIPHLLRTPAAVRFVSVEPMLGPVYVSARLDWVICGAETGPGARPMNLEWARNLRDQWGSAGIPFFFKSAGPGVPVPPDLDIHEYPKVDIG
jgi:protein gp37